MHECFTIQDWIEAWTERSPGDEDLAPLVPSDEDGSGVPSCDGREARFEVEPGVPNEVLSCPRCMAACDELDELLEKLEHFDPSVAAESFAKDLQHAHLAAIPLSEQATYIATEPRARTWAVCQRFLDEAASSWRQDPALAGARSSTAVLLAESLDERTYHPLWVADLKAKAHAYHGNSLRVLAHFDRADQELERAARWVRLGVGSGQREARVRTLLASLRIDQRRFDEAECLLGEVEAHYERTGQRIDLARTQLKRALVSSARGEPREAAEKCAQAFGNLDRDEDSRLAGLAGQNAVYYLLCAGETERARSLFSNLPASDERMVQLRRRWIEASLLRAEGRLGLAMEAFDEVRRTYADENLSYDVALVSLDQAAAALELGDHETLRELAHSARLLLREASAPTQAVSLLGSLATAIDQGRATQTVLAAIRMRLADARPAR
jgi:tetratricopeptide (TPR) repeat protein